MPEMTYTEKLRTTSCWCGINLAIPSDLYDYARRKKYSIYCPLGHTFVYGDTTEERLERAEQQLRATRDLLAAEERSHTATRGHLTRAKRQVHRAERGVCPHCNRSFQNLRRHVSTKHPEHL